MTRRAAVILLGVVALVAVAAGVALFVAPDGERTASTSTLARPAPEGTPQAQAPYKPDPAAAQAARRFLAGYLAYFYGHAGPDAIEGVSTEVLAHLEAHPLKRPAHLRERTPKIIELRSSSPAATRIRIVAIVDDGWATYPFSIELAHRDGRWLVVRVPDED